MAVSTNRFTLHPVADDLAHSASHFSQIEPVTSDSKSDRTEKFKSRLVSVAIRRKLCREREREREREYRVIGHFLQIAKTLFSTPSFSGLGSQ